jgi:hypothetical protein
MFEVELNGMFDATLCRYLYRSADAFHASSILDCKAHVQRRGQQSLEPYCLEQAESVKPAVTAHTRLELLTYLRSCTSCGVSSPSIQCFSIMTIALAADPTVLISIQSLRYRGVNNWGP